MTFGLHNVSPATPIALAERQQRQLQERTAVAARFWAKVDALSQEDCWLWQGGVNPKGYGRFSSSAKRGRVWPLAAHRVAWELIHGPIDSKVFVCHRCDVPRCVNPNHLFTGTQLDNMRDASRKGRLAGVRLGHQKLTAAQIREVRACVEVGEMRCLVADRFGISRPYLTQLMQGIRRQYDAPLGGAPDRTDGRRGQKPHHWRKLFKVTDIDRLVQPDVKEARS